MLDIILNGAYLLFQGAAMAVTVTLYNGSDITSHYTPEDRDTVIAMQAHREWWRKDSDCQFYGVMVPYVRDWPETIKHGDIETVIPPVPDTTAGQAIVFTKKVCEGKADEPIFLVDDVSRAKFKLVKRRQLTASDVGSMRPEFVPKWLPQVVSRIERVAATDPAAKSAMADINAYEANLLALAKEKAAAVASDAVAASAPAASAPAAASFSAAARAGTSEPVTPTAQTN
ncbi:hypothetical protein BTK96_001044 [Burkholderia pyrrocinia]|nr:hypothetical protein [Burkholderia pyrrocinia]EKS9892795.1 hypothetical protein [Burkholderia pyrrocinia]EKS9907670.1 hypothetical protein [Burkholderia pyrrocinia]